MEIDSVTEKTLKQKAETLQALAAGPLASSVAKLSGSSRGIPSERDFHFFRNFDEFKVPIKGIAEKSESLLKSIGSSTHLWGKQMTYPEDSEEAYDWLVNVSDEVIERCDVSIDEFHMLRKKEEGGMGGISSINSEDGFQLVYGKKKMGGNRSMEKKDGHDPSSLTSVNVASKDKKTTGAKPRLPFHIPTIPRPQDEYKIMVNNTNQPFEHVWLKRSEDGSRFIHPLEELSVCDFLARNTSDVEPVKPLPIESTLFKLVEEVKDLKELAAKLRNVDEFAVDLEHNHYRSFQGMTCLMQISTRSEDYVVDTLKLRVHIGPHLREAFKDPLKKKVMHGADRDVVWLQRDFGIYICNLFDTGQASRVLQLERNSLEYLLHYFCGVTAKKEYQNADWRVRPLPDEMVRYAREDTHYLLYIYDLMKVKLLSASAESGSGDDLLLEVYKRSYDICMQLYEKELLTDTSYLYIYGLGDADFNAQQLAIVAGLCQWRDVVARAEDESTGYILPNKALLEIARQMPLNAGRLRYLVRSRHPYVERNLGSVLNIIKSSIQNASAFESAAEQLKKGHLETVRDTSKKKNRDDQKKSLVKSIHDETPLDTANKSHQLIYPDHSVSGQHLASDKNEKVIADESETLPIMGTPTRMQTASTETMDISRGDYGNSVNGKIGECTSAPVQVKEELLELSGDAFESSMSGKGSFEQPGETGKIKNEQDNVLELPKESTTLSIHMGDTNIEMGPKTSAKTVTGATIQILKKPSRAFGALLGNSTSKRKLNSDQKDKVEQIKSSVNLPFHSFSGRDEQLKPFAKESVKPFEIHPTEPVATPAEITNLEDIISLESDLSNQESADSVPTTVNDILDNGENCNAILSTLESDTGDEPMCLSDLSSNFQRCFQSINQTRKNGQVESSHESEGLQLKPFDYSAARKQVKFGEDKRKEGEREGDKGLRGPVASKGRRKSSVVDRGPIDEEAKDFENPRRRQAFPVTGNRSATFR